MGHLQMVKNYALCDETMEKSATLVLTKTVFSAEATVDEPIHREAKSGRLFPQFFVTPVPPG